MAEQVLDVEFAGVLLDGPGREGMAKAVGVAAGHVGGASAAAEQLLEAVGREPHAGPQLAGPGDGPHERARRPPADGEVGLECGPAAAGEGDDALLVALAVANQQAAAGEVAVGQVERAQLGAADAGVEEEQHHGGIAPSDGGGGIARRHQARELGGAEGRDELGREPDVAQAAERRVVRPALQRDAAASVIGARLSGGTLAGAADAEPASRQQASARRLAS